MAAVSPPKHPHRISFGKKAERTVTAPLISVTGNNTLEAGIQHPYYTTPRPLANRYASQDNGLSPFAGGAGGLSPGMKPSSSTCLRDVKEMFTMQQVMRDTLETRRRPRIEGGLGNVVKQRHKKEFLRSWSREKIIITEEIIYPTTSLTVSSASGSLSSIGDTCKPYYPLERYNSLSGRSLPAASVTLVGVLPTHVAEHGRIVPIASDGVVTNETDRGRRKLNKQVSELECSTYLFSDFSSLNRRSGGSRVLQVSKSPQQLRSPTQLSSQIVRRVDTTVKATTAPKKRVQFCPSICPLTEHADVDQLV